MSTLISFDIGIHNFSYSISSINKNLKEPFNIYYIDNVDLLIGKKIKDLQLNQKFYINFHQFLNTIHDKLKICDICIIERQLMSKKNFKACNIYSHLLAHLAIFFPDMKIVPFSALKKYTYFNQYKLNYRQRKNWAIEYVTKIIEKQNDDTIQEWFHTFHPKKDDVADCILMTIVHVLENKLLDTI